MSIFDVIKYPISNSPTIEELDALPTELANRWRPFADWSHHSANKNIEYYYRLFSSSTDCHKDIVLLRKMIKEYESL